MGRLSLSLHEFRDHPPGPAGDNHRPQTNSRQDLVFLRLESMLRAGMGYPGRGVSMISVYACAQTDAFTAGKESSQIGFWHGMRQTFPGRS